MAMGTTPSFSSKLSPKVEISVKSDNKLKRILLKKDISPLTIKEHNDSRLKAYSPVR